MAGCWRESPPDFNVKRGGQGGISAGTTAAISEAAITGFWRCFVVLINAHLHSRQRLVFFPLDR